MVSAIVDFGMIEADDRILVAVSGGKDSSILLSQLLEIRRRAPMPFSVTPVIVDQKQPGFDVEAFRNWVSGLGVELIILEEDTYSIVKEKTPEGKAYCGLCSRLRRGILYTYAFENGFTKIALGHHRDDVNETILLNLFYTGKLATMPPKLTSDDGRNQVIRPLVYVPEDWLSGMAVQKNIPIIPCNLCGSQDGLRRQKVKQLLRQLEQENAHDVGASILAAVKNVRTSHLLDKRLFDFEGLERHANMQAYEAWSD
jgi:tRNA 2-thiocytidine biosynthesis protein TtcA